MVVLLTSQSHYRVTLIYTNWIITMADDPWYQTDYVCCLYFTNLLQQCSYLLWWKWQYDYHIPHFLSRFRVSSSYGFSLLICFIGFFVIYPRFNKYIYLSRNNFCHNLSKVSNLISTIHRVLSVVIASWSSCLGISVSLLFRMLIRARSLNIQMYIRHQLTHKRPYRGTKLTR